MGALVAPLVHFILPTLFAAGVHSAVTHQPFGSSILHSAIGRAGGAAGNALGGVITGHINDVNSGVFNEGGVNGPNTSSIGQYATNTAHTLGNNVVTQALGAAAGTPSFGTPAAPTASAGGGTPFGGGGPGAGSPAGLSIRGSTAPDIFPWTQLAPGAT